VGFWTFVLERTFGVLLLDSRSVVKGDLRLEISSGRAHE